VAAGEQIATYPEFCRYLTWFFFFGATLIMQVILFNTLISVIGAHYEEQYENKECYALQQRNTLFVDFLSVCKNKLSPLDQYFYIV